MTANFSGINTQPRNIINLHFLAETNYWILPHGVGGIRGCSRKNRIETRRLIRCQICASMQRDAERSKPRFVADMTPKAAYYCNTHLRWCYHGLLRRLNASNNAAMMRVHPSVKFAFYLMSALPACIMHHASFRIGSSLLPVVTDYR